MLSDGGEVALDWAESKEGGVGKLNFESPVMLILPGIVGECVWDHFMPAHVNARVFCAS